VKDYFLDNPERLITPAEIRDHLERLNKEGKVVINAKNILYAGHTVLRSLIKQSFVEKVQLPGRDPSYKLKK